MRLLRARIATCAGSRARQLRNLTASTARSAVTSTVTIRSALRSTSRAFDARGTCLFCCVVHGTPTAALTPCVLQEPQNWFQMSSGMWQSDEIRQAMPWKGGSHVCCAPFSACGARSPRKRLTMSRIAGGQVASHSSESRGDEAEKEGTCAASTARAQARREACKAESATCRKGAAACSSSQQACCVCEWLGSSRRQAARRCCWECHKVRTWPDRCDPFSPVSTSLRRRFEGVSPDLSMSLCKRASLRSQAAICSELTVLRKCVVSVSRGHADCKPSHSDVCSALLGSRRSNAQCFISVVQASHQ